MNHLLGNIWHRSTRIAAAMAAETKSLSFPLSSTRSISHHSFFSSVTREWSGVAKVSCIIRHRGIQLILAYSWARLAILVARKSRGECFIITPANFVCVWGGGGILFSRRPSVRVSVRDIGFFLNAMIDSHQFLQTNWYQEGVPT